MAIYGQMPSYVFEYLSGENGKPHHLIHDCRSGANQGKTYLSTETLALQGSQYHQMQSGRGHQDDGQNFGQILAIVLAIDGHF